MNLFNLASTATAKTEMQQLRSQLTTTTPDKTRSGYSTRPANSEHNAPSPSDTSSHSAAVSALSQPSSTSTTY